MQFTLDLNTVEPQKAAEFIRFTADLLFGAPVKDGAPKTPGSYPTPEPVMQVAAERPVPAPAATATVPAINKTTLRAKCKELKDAGKRQAILDAFAQLGVNHLDGVVESAYPKLWEVLHNAG
ncbi:MAG: hypothetical protein FWE40_05360 [Oscillospiraceae bacterium]|jgi:hypothetical protein|nr:hypothetical protein [Oscillospiraceae bacterium]